MRFVVTIDTEADCQWKADAKLSHDNLERLPRFQALCSRYAFPPTYLCTYDVVTHPAFDEHIRVHAASGAAEIGAHLHPWSNPPHEDPRLDGAKTRGYPSELPIDLFRRKLSALTAAILERTGAAPRSYRAGRWGFDASHVGPLLDLGYRVDCSTTPYMDWGSHAGATRGGPDFRGAPLRPHYLSDAQRGAQRKLLEVPMTIVTTSPCWAPDALHRFLVRRRSRWARAIKRRVGLQYRWLRPLPGYTAEDIHSACRAVYRMKLPVAMLMLHSSELCPGGAPDYSGDAAVEDLYRKLECAFRFMSESGARGVTLGQFADEWSE